MSPPALALLLGVTILVVGVFVASTEARFDVIHERLDGQDRVIAALAALLPVRLPREERPIQQQEEGQ
jgi:hypothetical protein